MEGPRLGVELELQMPAYTTATARQDPSHICDLNHSSWQCWITSSFVFNPRRMVTAVLKGYWEARRLNRPLDLSEAHLQALEQKYQLDPEKLKQLKIY